MEYLGLIIAIAALLIVGGGIAAMLISTIPLGKRV